MPVCALDATGFFKQLVNEVICLAAPFEFMAVSSWYKDFKQVSDSEVLDLLQKTRDRISTK